MISIILIGIIIIRITKNDKAALMAYRPEAFTTPIVKQIVNITFIKILKTALRRIISHSFIINAIYDITHIRVYAVKLSAVIIHSRTLISILKIFIQDNIKRRIKAMIIKIIHPFFLHIPLPEQAQTTVKIHIATQSNPLPTSHIISLIMLIL